MDAAFNQAFFPSTFNELFSVWNRFPDAVLYAGGTDLLWKQGKNILQLPRIILCLDKLEELHRITRTEHYLEIGSMSKLSRIIHLGKIVPEALTLCLENIAGIQLRNLATIGGNICSNFRMLDASAPLTALDAQYELRNAHTSRWVSAFRFHGADEEAAIGSQELLTRIRLPLHQWDYCAFKKFYPEDIYSSKALVFLANVQKNILSDIRVVYKADAIYRNKNGDSILTGKYLPLSRKTADDYVDNWKEYMFHINEIDKFSKNELINCIEFNVYNLTE
ncbi:MAG: FAD binding domain-containing protein [Treponema sp.]|jgi:CO/xanthine dehydrogenase FAD-binding subunit|nr:FAD binding domain-containing protein [Treponema sp.]